MTASAKKLIIPAACIIFVLCLLIFSETAVSAASRGLRLWFDNVLPSLFPFFVAMEILNSTGFAKTAGIFLEPVMRPVFNVPGCGSLALLMGIVGGYPAGAKLSCDLYKKRWITKIEAERLLAFTNNSGPLFITGAVAAGMYGAPRLGFLLLSCHVFACLSVGFLFRFYKARSNTRNDASKHVVSMKSTHQIKMQTTIKGADLAIIFGDAVRNSVSLILAIGGFIILFSVIISLLIKTGGIGSLAAALSAILSPLGIEKETIIALLSGFFEITTGSSLASGLRGVPVEQQLPAASFIIGWAGLSVHSQVLSITAGTDISIRPYLTGKFLQGIIASIYTWLGLKLFGSQMWLPMAAMDHHMDAGYGFIDTPALLPAQLAVLIIIIASLVIRAFANKNPRGIEPPKF